MFSKKALAALFVAVVLLSPVNAFAQTPQKETASGFKLPIFSVETPKKQVAVTFNAAWTAGDTEAILNILKEHGVKASFFLCGKWVDNNPELLKKLHSEGHDICSHGDTHAHVASLSLEQNKKEITGVHEKVKKILGVEMNLYRPAYGEYNATVLAAAESFGYYTVQWDVDSLDWQNLGAKEEINRVLNHKKLRNGSIILFHSDAKYTASVLPEIIKGLKEKGFELVPVSELIYKENYNIDHEGRQWLTE